MSPREAAAALSEALHLPEGSADVLVWYETTPPHLRVWVDERYLWEVKRTAPPCFEGYAVEVEKRPQISAH